MSRIEEALRRAAGQAARETVDAEATCPAGSALAEEPGSFELPDVDDFRSESQAAEAPQAAEKPPAAEAPPAAVAADPVLVRTEPVAAPPQVKRAVNERLILSDAAEPAAIEQYRKLAAILHQVQVERGTKIVMVASAMAGEGKTLTATNLALTLSESFGRRVILIDADLRRPTIHQVLQIPGELGLNDALKAESDAKLALVEVSPRLTVLPAGKPNPDPMSGLTSDRMRRIIDEAAAAYEWVVVDTPPVALLPDANLLAEMVDMVVLVIGAGTTPFEMVQRAVNAMDRNRIVGVVLNRVIRSPKTYQYYDYYAGSNKKSA